MSMRPEVKAALRQVFKVISQAKRDALRDRADLVAEINRKKEHERIAIVFSGMDCDCVAFTGKVRVVPATASVVERVLDQMYDNAEGPLSHYLMPPKQAQRIGYVTRDLAAEAHENGHPYVISYKGGPSL